jgi:hypothetical protein
MLEKKKKKRMSISEKLNQVTDDPLKELGPGISSYHHLL